MFIDSPNQLQVFRLIDRPAQVGEILFAHHRANFEFARVLIDEQRHVLAEPGIEHGAVQVLQSGIANRFGVETARKRPLRVKIAGIIVFVFAPHRCDYAIDEMKVDQRAIGGDAHDDIGRKNLGSLGVTIQDVVVTAGKDRPFLGATKLDDRLIVCLVRGGDDHLVQTPSPSQSAHHAFQHRSSGDVGQDFAGQTGASHPRLDDRHDVGIVHAAVLATLRTINCNWSTTQSTSAWVMAGNIGNDRISAAARSA